MNTVITARACFFLRVSSRLELSVDPDSAELDFRTSNSDAVDSQPFQKAPSIQKKPEPLSNPIVFFFPFSS